MARRVRYGENQYKNLKGNFLTNRVCGIVNFILRNYKADLEEDQQKPKTKDRKFSVLLFPFRSPEGEPLSRALSPGGCRGLFENISSAFGACLPGLSPRKLIFGSVAVQVPIQRFF